MRPARTFDSRGSAARGAGLATLASRALLVSAAFAAASVARAQAPVGAPAPAARPPEPKPAAAAAPTGAEAPPGQAQCGVHGGHISADLPFNTTLDKTFGIDVSLEACPGHENDAVEVRMEQTTNVSYEPRVFKLKPGEWQTVDTRVLRASGGLAQVVISTAASWAPPLVVTLDAGFASSNVKANLEPTLESRVVYPVALSFVDEQDRPVSLGGPVTVQLVASKAQLREVGRADWSSRVEYPLESGANSTLPVEMRAQGLTPQTGLLAATLTINDTQVLRRQQFEFRIVPQWWIQLLMGVLGGILHSVYSLLVADKAAPWRWRVVVPARVVTGVFAGLLAYLLAAWNVLGIQVDTTSLRAYVILGFLFSYVGLDALLSRFLSNGKDAQGAAGGARAAAGPA